MTRHYIIPIFVPHFGCPHDCVFCNQKRITGLSTNVKPEEVASIVEDHLRTFKEDAFIEVAFYGGSFTAIDIEIQKDLLSIPYEYKKKGKINEIRLSTRPDAIDKEILDLLKTYSVDTIELGVQSLDDDILIKSGRGHTSAHVYRAANLIKSYGFNLGLQMMVGLPGDSFEKDLYTCEEFIKIKPYCVRIYPTLVIRDTFLEEQFHKGKYIPYNMEEAIEISSLLLSKFDLNDINVIRIGLQPTENIQLGKDVIGGPFHPSFRQEVESNIFIRSFEEFLNQSKIESQGKTLVIEASNRKISTIAGQKGRNKDLLKNKYGFSTIKLYGKDLGEKINIFIDERLYELDFMRLKKLFINKYN